MKRLKFKKPFNGMDNAKKLIPESYKVDGNEFEITDGNETYRVKWSSLINEGIVLTSSNKARINEDMSKIKHLMGFKSQETLGTVKGAERLNENKKFGNILNKTKRLLNENLDNPDYYKELEFERNRERAELKNTINHEGITIHILPNGQFKIVDKNFDKSRVFNDLDSAQQHAEYMAFGEYDSDMMDNRHFDSDSGQGWGDPTMYEGKVHIKEEDNEKDTPSETEKDDTLSKTEIAKTFKKFANTISKANFDLKERDLVTRLLNVVIKLAEEDKSVDPGVKKKFEIFEKELGIINESKKLREQEVGYEKSGLNNPELADLNKNNKISPYEKKRSSAIEKAMNEFDEDESITSDIDKENGNTEDLYEKKDRFDEVFGGIYEEEDLNEVVSFEDTKYAEEFDDYDDSFYAAKKAWEVKRIPKVKAKVIKMANELNNMISIKDGYGDDVVIKWYDSNAIFNEVEFDENQMTVSYRDYYDRKSDVETYDLNDYSVYEDGLYDDNLMQVLKKAIKGYKKKTSNIQNKTNFYPYYTVDMDDKRILDAFETKEDAIYSKKDLSEPSVKIINIKGLERLNLKPINIGS